MSRSRSRRRPATSTAGVGDTVEYVYCGQNTERYPARGRTPRRRPTRCRHRAARCRDGRRSGRFVVQHRHRRVRSGYDVTLSDLGTTITNHAVVTVRTQEATPRQFQATAVTDVEVPLPARSVPCVARTGGQGADLPCHVQRVEPVHLQRRGRLLGPGRQRPQPRRPPGRVRTSSRPVRGTPTDGTGMPKARRSGSTTATTPGQYPAKPTVVQATCTGGEVTPPTVTLASTPGIAYTASPPGPYSSTTTTTVTVTATLKPGFDWGQITEWLRRDPVMGPLSIRADVRTLGRAIR